MPLMSDQAVRDRVLAEGWRLAQAGAFAEAFELLRRAGPGLAARLSLARAQALAGDHAAADETLAAALGDHPDEPDLMTDAARMAVRLSRPTLALTRTDRALATGTRTSRLLRERGNALMQLGDLAGAVETWREACRIDPTDRLTASNIIYAASLDPGATTAGLKALQRGIFPGAARAVPPPPDPQGRVHVGYVSACFRSHAAARVFVPLIERHDRDRVRITCYSGSPRRDGMTVRLRLAVDGWRSLVGLSDEEAAGLIRADAVDVLVDLDGHTSDNRLGLFALRPAPVQVSAWGYLPGPGTPGIDALVTDPVLAPRPERHLFPEALVDVACPTLCDLQPAPAGDEAPSDPAGPVRLGCFARAEKLSDPLLAMWGRILAARPATDLILKDDLYADPGVERRVLRRMADFGIAPHRIRFEGREALALYLARHRDIDLALDTYPYSGGLVSLDALSQGVPVLTLRGALPSARTTASILALLQRDDLVTTTPDDYVAAALALIDDVQRLRQSRAAARGHYERVVRSALDRTAAQFDRFILAARAGAMPVPNGPMG